MRSACAARDTPLQLAELLLRDAGLLRRKNETGLARIGLQFVFRSFELNPHPVELPRQPLAGMLGRLPPSLEF